MWHTTTHNVHVLVWLIKDNLIKKYKITHCARCEQTKKFTINFLFFLFSMLSFYSQFFFGSEFLFKSRITKQNRQRNCANKKSCRRNTNLNVFLPFASCYFGFTRKSSENQTKNRFILFYWFRDHWRIGHEWKKKSTIRFSHNTEILHFFFALIDRCFLSRNIPKISIVCFSFPLGTFRSQTQQKTKNNCTIFGYFLFSCKMVLFFRIDWVEIFFSLRNLR